MNDQGQIIRATVVVPCFNEADRLPISSYLEFVRGQPSCRLLLVNDGSTDRTLVLLSQLHDASPGQVDVLDLNKNAGKAEAVRQGVLRAAAQHPQYIGYWDADLATPLDAVPDFCHLLDTRKDLEIVCGSRVMLLGRTIVRRWPRHYAGRIVATMISLTLGLATYDTQCGAKLFRCHQPILALFEEPFCTRWLFDVEMMARLIQARRGADMLQPHEVIYEQPLNTWREVSGSKVGLTDFPRAFWQLWQIHRKYLRAPRSKP